MYVLLLYLLTFFATEERSVVIPEGTAVFEVQTSDTVRLTGSGIAGASINFDVTGPAKIERINSISKRVNGRNIIGAAAKEAEVIPTGAGSITVTITVTNPTGDKPKVTKYQFEAK